MENDEIEIDLLRLFNALLKHIKLIAAAAVVFCGFAVIYLLLAQPVYESKATLKIKPPRSATRSALSADPILNVQSTKQLMTTYMEIIKSPGIIEPIIKQTEEQDKEGNFPNAEAYAKGKIKTELLKDSDLLAVTVYADTPQKAKKVNDLLLTRIVGRLTELNRGEYKQSKGFLEKQTNVARKNVQDAENKLRDFRKKNEFFNPDRELDLTMKNSEKVGDMLTDANASLVANQSKLDSVNAQLKGAAASIASNDTVEVYSKRLADLEARRISQMELYTEEHPDLIKTKDEIAETERKLQEEIDKVAQLKAPSNNKVHQELLAAKFSGETGVKIAKARIARLEQMNKKNRERIKRLADLNQRYKELSRNVTLASDIYAMVSKRLEEAKIAEASVAGDILIVDRGSFNDKPVKPRKVLIVVIATLAGICISSCFIVVREILDTTIKTAEDVERYLELPLFGSIPDADLATGSDSKIPVGYIEKIKNFLKTV